MAWRLKGQVVVACNCDYGCPCNFNARPTRGKCEGGWTWHVEEGHYDDIPLDGLNFSVYANWPGAIHEGNGEALILVDERADEAQREAIATLAGGEVGARGASWAGRGRRSTVRPQFRTTSTSRASTRTSVQAMRSSLSLHRPETR